MRLTVGLASVVWLLRPRRCGAQTAEIERQVEVKLWYLRYLDRVEAASGLPAAVALSVVLGLVVLLAALAWLWHARGKRRD